MTDACLKARVSSGKQLFVHWHCRRAIPIVVSSIDRTSVFAVEPCSVGTKCYQVRQRLGAGLKIDVVAFAHSSWKIELPSLTLGLLTRCVETLTFPTHKPANCARCQNSTPARDSPMHHG